jgi:hypothetical protein
MKVVQTQVSETEYAILEAYAKSHEKTIKETVREAIRKLTLNDSVDPDDPIFKMFPLTRKKGKHPDASERHDLYLYGWDK